LKHYASPKFWALYHGLPAAVRDLADKNFQLLKSDPQHPSLHLKKIGALCSVRIGLHHRALATDVEGNIYWIWIGTHADYDKIVA
jgi:hypothetical protein